MTSFLRSQSAAAPRSKPRKIQKANKLIQTFLPGTARSNVQWHRTQSQPASLALAFAPVDPSLQAWKPPASVVSWTTPQPKAAAPSVALQPHDSDKGTETKRRESFLGDDEKRLDSDKTDKINQTDYWTRRPYDNCEWLCDRQAVRIRLQGVADWHSEVDEPAPFTAWNSTLGNRLTVVPERAWDGRDHWTVLCHATATVTHAQNNAPIWNHANLVAFVSLDPSTDSGSSRAMFHDSTSSSHGAAAFQLALVRDRAKQCLGVEMSAVRAGAAKPCNLDLELTVFYF